MGTNKRVLKGLTVSRRKKVIFYCQPSKMKNINRLKVSRYLKSYTISADLHCFLAPEKSFNWKNQFPWSKKPSLLDIAIPYLLRSRIIPSRPNKNPHDLIEHCISYLFGIVQSSVSLGGVNVCIFSSWYLDLGDAHNGQLTLIFSYGLFH